MITRSKHRPSFKLASGLVSFIAIILLFAAPDNSANGNTTLVNQINPDSQLAANATAQSKKSAIATIADAAAAPFSSEIRLFSPELYDLSAFGDHEVIAN